MAGIVGINAVGKVDEISRMLEKIDHRGKAGNKLLKVDGATLGAIWPGNQTTAVPPTLNKNAVWDASTPPLPEPLLLNKEWEPFSIAVMTNKGLFLARDGLGIRPLYYGYTSEKDLCFASEVKALLSVTEQVHEFPPGTWYRDNMGFHAFNQINRQRILELPENDIALGLRLRLEKAVSRRIDHEVMGCWLSGGLDSSVIATLARPLVGKLHTFASGLEGAQDLMYAGQVARHLNTVHHEVIVTLQDLINALPNVIYYLESFDALLVRSSITNYLVARIAADYVGSVFSGEGGDELFAGYEYLKNLPAEQITNELVDITNRLHNTALQRVDRSASANGLVVHVPLLDPDVVSYALQIPVELKLRHGKEVVEKWILRQSLVELLPEKVLWRKKAKFWQGTGVGELLAQYADNMIPDVEFRQERVLSNGWKLNTKEELMYYRIFHDHFGDIEDLSWMGRTKGSPVH